MIPSKVNKSKFLVLLSDNFVIKVENDIFWPIFSLPISQITCVISYVQSNTPEQIVSEYPVNIPITTAFIKNW